MATILSRERWVNYETSTGGYAPRLKCSRKLYLVRGKSLQTSKSSPWITCGIQSVIAARRRTHQEHYNDIIMSAMASQNTGVSIVYSIVRTCADQRKHQSSASLAFVRGIHRWPVNSPHKRPVTRKMFLFDDFIMNKKPVGYWHPDLSQAMFLWL